MSAPVHIIGVLLLILYYTVFMAMPFSAPPPPNSWPKSDKDAYNRRSVLMAVGGTAQLGHVEFTHTYDAYHNRRRTSRCPLCVCHPACLPGTCVWPRSDTCPLQRGPFLGKLRTPADDDIHFEPGQECDSVQEVLASCC